MSAGGPQPARAQGQAQPARTSRFQSTLRHNAARHGFGKQAASAATTASIHEDATGLGRGFEAAVAMAPVDMSMGGGFTTAYVYDKLMAAAKAKSGPGFGSALPVRPGARGPVVKAMRQLFVRRQILFCEDGFNAGWLRHSNYTVVRFRSGGRSGGSTRANATAFDVYMQVDALHATAATATTPAATVATTITSMFSSLLSRFVPPSSKVADPSGGGSAVEEEDMEHIRHALHMRLTQTPMRTGQHLRRAQEGAAALFVDVGPGTGVRMLTFAAEGFPVVAFAAVQDQLQLLRSSLCLGRNRHLTHRVVLYPVALGTTCDNIIW